MPLKALPDIMIEPLVRNALLEDLGRAGDVTSAAIIPLGQKWKGALVARQAGVVAGLALAEMAFRLIDPSIKFIIKKSDGAVVKPKDVIATLQGTARNIVTSERVALNLLCHLSGIATATYQLVKAIKPYKTKICCTRKTTPGLRIIEKYAVRVGGGSNHRFGLDDAILIKDNHIAVAGGVRKAVTRARQAAGHLVKIEVEIDTIEQLKEVIELPIDAVLLDNMSVPTLKKAVALVGGRLTTEASGRITLDSVNAVASAGVDIISVGWITHSAPILDIGLDEA